MGQLKSIRVGIDIGGTFTDLMAFEEESRESVSIKIPTTPYDPSVGAQRAFKKLTKQFRASSISALIHATTIATNALFGQTGLELPRTALITTRGFKDVIEIGRQRRPELYNIMFQLPIPLVPRKYRFEVTERVSSKGQVVEKVREAELKEIVSTLKNQSIRSLAVGLLNSYANPGNEDAIRDYIKKTYHDLAITTSSSVAPEYREYERISTAVVNAVLLPIVAPYLTKMVRRLRRAGCRSPLVVMQSNGGIASADVASSIPFSIVESGPVAGVVAAGALGELLHLRSVLSFDMGGTTAKAGVVLKGRPEVVSEYEVGGKVHRGRLVKGSGYPIRFPFVDLAECSSGGGTIGWVDEGGALRVGPKSAGAVPGPACYDLGGQEPTITDANLVLGRLNSRYLLGGQLKVYPEKSRESFRKTVCVRLGCDITEAAISMLRLVNSEMSRILRIVTIERGLDPAEFTVIAFGGAGPLHACELANELGLSEVVVPPSPGLFSSLGMLHSDFTHYHSRPIMEPLESLEPKNVEDLFSRLEALGRETLKSEKVREKDTRFLRQFSMRYLGQSYELMIPFKGPLNERSMKLLGDAFHRKHNATYGSYAKEESIEVVNAHVVSVGIVPKLKLPLLEKGGSEPPGDSITDSRTVYDLNAREMACPVYCRSRFKAGNHLVGPSVVEQYDSTTWIPEGWRCVVDNFGDLRLTEE